LNTNAFYYVDLGSSMQLASAAAAAIACTVLRSRHEQFCQQKNAKCLLCFGDERPEQTAC
jgi:hypothetical protein